MATFLTFHGHPAELVELAATLTVGGHSPCRMKRCGGRNGDGWSPGYARIRSTCPMPCCAGRDVRLVRYDTLKVVTA